jgi:DNA-binding response OmpR family regulator
MLFPATGAGTEPAAAPRVEAAPAGTETILLAEDESELRAFVRDVLTRHGYTVLEAANGCDALELSRRQAGAIHLLLADVVMPGMGGLELAKQFGREHPKTPILLMSGYTEHLQGHSDKSARYIQKPFTSTALLTRLRVLLEPAKH